MLQPHEAMRWSQDALIAHGSAVAQRELLRRARGRTDPLALVSLAYEPPHATRSVYYGIEDFLTACRRAFGKTPALFRKRKGWYDARGRLVLIPV